MKNLSRLLVCVAMATVALFAAPLSALAQDSLFEERLGPGDIIRVQVYQSPDLTQETRILESGHISYPLIGATKVAGLTIPEAEALIAKALKAGGFIQQPQVTIAQLQARKKNRYGIGRSRSRGSVPIGRFEHPLVQYSGGGWRHCTNGL